jgi:hypothetical protein
VTLEQKMTIIKKTTSACFLVIVAFFQSCAHVDIEPTKKPEELSSIILQENIVVLFNVYPSEKSEKWGLSLATNYFNIKIQAAQGSQPAKIVAPASPSDFADRDGWMYVTLPPGRYFINLMFKPLTGALQGKWKELTPTYMVDIVKSKPIVYIGSFKIYCRSKETFEVLILVPVVSHWLEECSLINLLDESSKALAISHTYFNKYGPPVTNLAHIKTH